MSTIEEKPAAVRREGPSTHHVDRRADAVVRQGAGDPDDLLSTRQVAEWWGVSEQFLEIARSRDFGPEFVRLSPRVIRYRRSACLRWLDARAHASTLRYSHKRRGVGS